jgi:hypothetical protein
VSPPAWRRVWCGSVTLSWTIIPSHESAFWHHKLFLVILCPQSAGGTEESRGFARSCLSGNAVYFLYCRLRARIFVRLIPRPGYEIISLGWSVCLRAGAHTIHGLGLLGGLRARKGCHHIVYFTTEEAQKVGGHVFTMERYVTTGSLMFSTIHPTYTLSIYLTQTLIMESGGPGLRYERSIGETWHHNMV